ncbi:MAG TPA: hypothetical protein VGG75_08780 [Trebonia sp.]|jgi:hypothetical protein
MREAKYYDSGDICDVRFGYTLSEIGRLATAAVKRDFWHQSMPFDDRLDVAWSAIAERLYACDQKPDARELIRAAWTALRDETESNWHTHGVSRSASVFDGEQTMQGFARYWFARVTRGPEEKIVEHIAFGQIWDALSERHKRVITALAIHDDYGRAAQALGITKRQTYVSQLAGARRAFRALWHEGETPSRHWGMDRRRNPDAQYHDTHPNRSAAIEAMRRRASRRESSQGG